MREFIYRGRCKMVYLMLIIMIVTISFKNSGGGDNSIPAAKDALSIFYMEPGFKIELLADEPLIFDPVDMEINKFGRLYVVEMHGYPLDKGGSGKIKLLSDTNGDGRTLLTLKI